MYVAYIESAPWNTPELAGESRYAGVGRALIREAVELSLQAGYNGKIGLHALPSAIEFYDKKCGMTDHGAQRDMEGLRYFEFTSARAAKFLKGEIET